MGNKIYYMSVHMNNMGTRLSTYEHCLHMNSMGNRLSTYEQHGK